MNFKQLALGLTLALICGFTAKADQSVTVKNFSNQAIYVAISHHINTGPNFVDHVVKGWTQIPPNAIQIIQFENQVTFFSASINYQNGNLVVFQGARQTLNKYYTNNGFRYIARTYDTGLKQYLFGN